MEMRYIERCDGPFERRPHGGRPVEPSPETGRKVPDLDAVDVDWALQFNVRYAGTINVRRVDVHVMSSRY
jgi:hypothetical protein